jgi:quercetin dioxygenase-like cupin family protein
MYFNDLKARQKKEIFPGVSIRSFWGQQMLMAVVDLDPGTKVPPHNHPHEQCGAVIDGQLELTINGESRLLQPGDTYLIPGGVEHSAKVGQSPAQVLDVFSPVREEYKY